MHKFTNGMVQLYSYLIKITEELKGSVGLIFEPAEKIARGDLGIIAEGALRMIARRSSEDDYRRSSENNCKKEL